jgi:hypothetical protein
LGDAIESSRRVLLAEKCRRRDHAERARMTRERVARAPDARVRIVHMSKRLQAEGRTLRDEDVAAMAFGRGGA